MADRRENSSEGGHWLEGEQWTAKEIARLKERPMPAPRMRMSLEEAKKRFPPPQSE